MCVYKVNVYVGVGVPVLNAGVLGVCVCVCVSVSGCVSALLNYKIRDMENFASGFLTF